MPLTKQYSKNKQQCKVTFSLTGVGVIDAETVCLVGDFNNWDPAACPMKWKANTGFCATLNLTPGVTHKFRYLVDGSKWCNDPEADGYEYCSFAQTENSIITI